MDKTGVIYMSVAFNRHIECNNRPKFEWAMEKNKWLKKNCFEIWEKQEKRAFYSVFVLCLSFLHSLLNLWPIFTFYTAIESYGDVDYTCFIHFEKSQKMKALGHKNVILVKSRTSQPWTLPPWYILQSVFFLCGRKYLPIRNTYNW